MRAVRVFVQDSNNLLRVETFESEEYARGFGFGFICGASEFGGEVRSIDPFDEDEVSDFFEDLSNPCPTWSKKTWREVFEEARAEAEK